MKNWVKILLFITFFVFVILLVLFIMNKVSVYSSLAEYYVKHDNYSLAQKYYEKSYLLGNQDSEFREKYVNLLINSPLTIEAQQRLVDIAEDSKSDSASESAKYFLYNLKREIHNKYPNNYIQQAPYNQKILHWGKLPITYSIKQTKGVSPEIITAVNDAFDAWERASSVRIRFARVPVNADIVVSFTNYVIKEPKAGERYVVAYTVPDIASNKLNRMDMILNVSNLDGKLFTPNQIYNIALHEVFHALGFMGHSSDKENIMYLAQTKDALGDDKRCELTDADKATLELFYKIKPDITNANEFRYEYIPYPVIGDNAEVNYAKADEAKSYIRKAPRVPSGYIDLAQTQINQKDYVGAMDTLNKALYLSKSDDTKYLALFNLALVYFLDKDYELADFYAKKAAELKDDDDLHHLSAQILICKNDKQGAIKEYLYLLSKNPDNIDYVANLTNLYLERHDYINARKTLKAYVRRNPHERNNPRFRQCKLLLL